MLVLFIMLVSLLNLAFPILLYWSISPCGEPLVQIRRGLRPLRYQRRHLLKTYAFTELGGIIFGPAHPTLDLVSRTAGDGDLHHASTRNSDGTHHCNHASAESQINVPPCPFLEGKVVTWTAKQQPTGDYSRLSSTRRRITG
jgi:hypothetical protein